jgi:riboflavin kinase/FMN adenylyltransferase
MVVGRAHVRASGAAEIRLPQGICLPPVGQYAGAVLAQTGAGQWRPALVHLAGADGTARVFSDAQFAPTPGSAVSVRFLGAASAKPHSDRNSLLLP